MMDLSVSIVTNEPDRGFKDTQEGGGSELESLSKAYFNAPWNFVNEHCSAPRSAWCSG